MRQWILIKSDLEKIHQNFSAYSRFIETNSLFEDLQAFLFPSLARMELSSLNIHRSEEFFKEKPCKEMKNIFKHHFFSVTYVFETIEENRILYSVTSYSRTARLNLVKLCVVCLRTNYLEYIVFEKDFWNISTTLSYKGDSVPRSK